LASVPGAMGTNSALTERCSTTLATTNDIR
jgi:hypothetical protein